MHAAAELGRNPVHEHQPEYGDELSMEMSRLTRDGTAEPVSRDKILRRGRGQGNIFSSCSADHEQYRQPYPVAPYSRYMTYIMATTRYSYQQESKSRQNPCQVQPTENIGKLSASRSCLRVGITVSTCSYFCTMCGLENLGLVDQNWLERNFSVIFPVFC